MKTITKLFVLASFLTLLGGTIQAQVTTSSSATATIVATIDLILEEPMDFGNLAVTDVPGVVTMEASAASTRSQVGGVTFPVLTGTYTAAVFTVHGENNATYGIILPSADLVITNTTGTPGTTMIVNNFTSSPTPTGTLSGSGAETLYVGADLLVEADQAPGVYVSAVPFDVTVNYN